MEFGTLGIYMHLTHLGGRPHRELPQRSNEVVCILKLEPDGT